VGGEKALTDHHHTRGANSTCHVLKIGKYICVRSIQPCAKIGSIQLQILHSKQRKRTTYSKNMGRRNEVNKQSKQEVTGMSY
jgi:hypothetical protein